MKNFINFLIMVGMLSLPTAAGAATVTLAWDGNSPAPQGYRLFMRTGATSYNYKSPTWQGTATSHSVTSLAVNTRYYFVVRAYSGTIESGNSNEVSIVPTATTANQAPVADAGPDKAVSSKTLVTLDGSGSTDANGNIASYSWARIAGPTVTISNAGSAKASFTAPSVSATTTLDFRLTVRDSAGLTSTDTCRVTVVPTAAKDSDGDGLSDISEINTYKTDPNKADTDGDGVSDGAEVKAGTDPNVASSRSLPTSTVVIVDNRSSDTLATGTWDVSGGAGSYNADAFWARGGDDTFTWYFTAPKTGRYEVSEWHSAWSTRTSAAPLQITYAGGTKTVYVNQKLNGGKWNSMGAYDFTAGSTYKVALTSVADSSSTCADAIRWSLTTAVAQDSGSSTTTAPAASVIVDNHSGTTLASGAWSVSGGTGAYPPGDPNADALWARGGDDSFIWYFTPPKTGRYEVSEWHSAWSTRTSAAPLQIFYDGGSKTVYVNQKVNGGKWNSMGIYNFVGGTNYKVTLTSVADSSSTCADAIQWAPVQ